MWNAHAILSIIPGLRGDGLHLLGQRAQTIQQLSSNISTNPTHFIVFFNSCITNADSNLLEVSVFTIPIPIQTCYPLKTGYLSFF